MKTRVVSILGATLVFVANTRSDAGEAAQPAAKASCCCARNLEPAAPLTDRSIYQLDSTWTNDAGKPIKLAVLRGRTQVVAMFFANCAYACPLIVNDMKRIEAALPESFRSRVGFTLVSFDSERDTPETLSAFRKSRGLAQSRWTLLRGQPDDILELAAVLGVKFKKDARGQFAHSNLITVLNSEGEIVHQQIGLNQSIEETVRIVRQMTER
ncbi:MAG: SCO family protein [Verrucomicrobia bacterium]|nr:SCO family protein [Verrucomicrobiota bacterium]